MATSAEVTPNGGLVRQSSKMAETFRLRSYNKLPRIITIIIFYFFVQSSFLFWNTRHERDSWSLWHWSLRVCWLVDGIHPGDQLQHSSQTRKTCCTSRNNKWSPLIEVKGITWIHCMLTTESKTIQKESSKDHVQHKTRFANLKKKMVYFWSDNQHSLIQVLPFRLVNRYQIPQLHVAFIIGMSEAEMYLSYVDVVGSILGALNDTRRRMFC